MGGVRDECCELTPPDGVLDLVLGFEVRSVSIIGGLGDREDLVFLDIAEVERFLEEGKDDNEDRRAAALP